MNANGAQGRHLQPIFPEARSLSTGSSRPRYRCPWNYNLDSILDPTTVDGCRPIQVHAHKTILSTILYFRETAGKRQTSASSIRSLESISWVTQHCYQTFRAYLYPRNSISTPKNSPSKSHHPPQALLALFRIPYNYRDTILNERNTPN
jgi:hypothetical protein